MVTVTLCTILCITHLFIKWMSCAQNCDTRNTLNVITLHTKKDKIPPRKKEQRTRGFLIIFVGTQKSQKTVFLDKSQSYHFFAKHLHRKWCWNLCCTMDHLSLSNVVCNFLIYVWVKKCVEIYVILFKNWKWIV